MESITIEDSVDFAVGNRRRKTIPSAPQSSPTRIPRVARMMALAIRINGLVRQGTIADYADAARLGHVSRARVTQIMSLLHLAPDIQEEILFLPVIRNGRDPIRERMVRRIAIKMVWSEQRKMWRDLCSASRGELAILTYGIKISV